MSNLSLVKFEEQPICDIVAAGYVDKLEKRIAELEDCLQELAPFANCVRVDMKAHFEAETEELAQGYGFAFKRDTLYLDQRIFRKVAKLLRAKIVVED